MEPKAHDTYWMLEGRKRDFFVCATPDEEPPWSGTALRCRLGYVGSRCFPGYARFTHQEL